MEEATVQREEELAPPPSPTCTYHYYDGGRCGLKDDVAGDADGYCILHCQDLAKDLAAFQAAANAKIAAEDYHFQGCVVPDGAALHFGGKEFLGRTVADFRRSRWHGNATADFWPAQFHNQARADFTNASLQRLEVPVERGDDEFSGLFRGKADFHGARFGQPVTFQSCQFAADSSFAGVDLQQVTFRGCALGEVSFRDAAHLAEAEFDNVTWGRLPEGQAYSRLGWLGQWIVRRWERLIGGTDRPVCWDEHAAREGSNQEDYAAAERVYRGLKQSYERRGDYPRSAQLSYGEMEMRRLAQPSGLQRGFFSILAVYWHLSGYGLQWRKAGVWFLAASLLFAALHGLLGFQVAQPDPSNPGGAMAVVQVQPFWSGETTWQVWLLGTAHALWFSLGAMLLRPSSIYTPTSALGPFLVLVQAALGPLLLGLMALAIRQRVRR